MAQPIDIPSPEMAKHLARIEKNRDFAAGAEAVKKAGTTYLPLPESGMSVDDYNAFKQRAPFYPAVSRTLDGWMGLAFRNDPVLVSPTLEPYKDAITANGDSLEELSEQNVRETMLTNWTGLLVDYPASHNRPTNLNAQNAEQLGQRAYLALYPFEAILEVRHGVVNNVRVIVYARLLENADEVRELVLRDGIYQIDVHTRVDGQWFERTDIPRRQGKPLTFIPFQIVSTKNTRCPSKAMLEDSVDINNSHYELAADLRQALFLCGNPKYVVMGVKPVEADEDGNVTPRHYPLGSSRVWELEGEGTDAKLLTFPGDGLVSIREELKDYKSQLATVGARILQDEKAVAEAAETLEIRRSSENATLAGAVRTVARHLEIALRWMAWWMGAADPKDSETRFSLNTDFVPTRMSSADLTAIVAAWQAGALSEEEMFYQLRRGELIDEAITWEEHKAKVETAALATLGTPGVE